jgi:predicted DNA-binding transcriptional regulator AlpA
MNHQRELRMQQAAARHAASLVRKQLIVEKQLVDRRRAADLLGVTLRTLRRWQEDNQGPPRVSFGPRKIYFALPDILEHLAAKERRRNKRSRKNGMTYTATLLTPPAQQ